MAQSSEMTASGSGVLDLIQGVVDACSVPAGERGVDGWMDLIAEVTAGMSALAAARDAAIVRLAALEEVVTEDGVIGVQVNGLGSVCVDAGAMVSTATGTSARFGEELVKQAVTRVVRVPAVQQAMTEGVLDDYKARCIVGELTDVPVELARTVVDVLAPEMRERSGPALRRRTRDILFRLAPELLKERLREARNAVSVRRWLGEPGTDNWSAVFPSERSARAWAAVDALAHRYREDGAYPTLEQARAYALLDLVDGNATVETVLDLTVAADALAEAIERQGADESVADARPTRPSAQALSDAPSPRPPVRRGSDRDPGRDASPGRGVDAPERHVSAPERGGGAPERHVSKAERCETSRTREQDALEPIFITVSGARGSEVRWMPLDALPAVPLTAPGRTRVAGPTPSWARSRVGDPGPALRFAHPVSGALVDLDHELSTDAYRPNVRLKSFIRQRDGRCRFPGCVIAARWCDIDHVIPWPHGPTAADNLMCLCRRHHRIKQRLRWRAQLRVDGTVVWTAPNGATVTTEPVDHLRARESRVSALPPVTAAQIDQLREDEELLDLYDAVREARRTEPQRRAEAEAAAEAEFIARGSRAHLDAADAHAAAIVADAGDGSGAEVAAAEGVAAEIRAAARLRPPPAPEELRRAFRARRAEELRRQREVRRGIRPRRPSRHDDAYLDHGSLDHVGPHRQSLDHQSDLEEGGWQDRDWCFEPAQRLRVSAVHYRPHRRYRRAMRRQRRRQRRREANGGPPF